MHRQKEAMKTPKVEGAEKRQPLRHFMTCSASGQVAAERGPMGKVPSAPSPEPEPRIPKPPFFYVPTPA